MVHAILKNSPVLNGREVITMNLICSEIHDIGHHGTFSSPLKTTNGPDSIVSYDGRLSLRVFF